MDALFVALRGVAIHLTDLMHLGIKRLRVLIPLVIEPVQRVMRFEIGSFLKNAPPCEARYTGQCRV